MRRLYREKQYFCGDFLEVDIFPVFKKQNGRRKKAKPTTETQQKLNQRNAERKLIRLLNTNFTSCDIRFDLTYNDKFYPSSPEEAQKQCRNFLRRVDYYRKKHGMSKLKYVFVTEIGKKEGRLHHHVVMSGGIDVNKLSDIWGRGYTTVKPLKFNEQGIVGIAKYASVNNTTPIESNVQLSQGTGGKNLGTTGSGKLNHVSRILYGNNNYAQSAVRQLINSTNAAGSVWTPACVFDRPPSWVSNFEGFARQLDPDFLAVVETAAIPCRTGDYEAPSVDGTSYTPNTTYTLYDKFFLLSMPEIFGTWDSSNIKDGVQLEYYIGMTQSERIKRNSNGTGCPCFLRSPIPWLAHFVRFISADGSQNSTLASGNNGIAPACIIA